MDLLLVEDKDSFRRLLTQALADSAWAVRAVPDPQEALRALAEQPFHVLVTDLRLPGMSGLELIRRARLAQPSLRVVLMSAFGEPKDIVEAMRLGADDFLPKPFDLDAFLALLDRLRALVGAPPPDPAEPWVAHSPAMLALEGALRQAAASELPVLFRGERGSGRERSARRLHCLRHPAAPYLSLPAATLGPEGPDPRTLQLLQGGSLYLGGLEHLAPVAAGPLALAMDSEPGRRLAWMAGIDTAGSLPRELAERLGVLELRLLPLRERREDTLGLARAGHPPEPDPALLARYGHPQLPGPGPGRGGAPLLALARGGRSGIHAEGCRPLGGGPAAPALSPGSPGGPAPGG